MSAPASVTLAICSRNRPDDLRRSVARALEILPPSAQLLVVDQTQDCARNIAPGNARLQYEHRPGRGVAVARNQAMVLAQSEVVVFTDDDCAPRAEMVQHLQRAFLRPDVAMAFGTVNAMPSAGGFIASYTPRRTRILRGRTAKLADSGIGACMAVRRDAALALGGFDERLGPGAEFASNEEGEFAYRMLKSGRAIAHIPEAIVDHWGARPWVDGRRYSYETYRAIAATCAMHIRTGDPVAGLLLAQQFGLVLWDIAKAVAKKGRPSGLSAAHGLASGIGPGLGLRPVSAPLLRAPVSVKRVANGR